MAKLRTIYRCTECGGAAPQWAGKCPSCGEWNSLVEEVEEVSARASAPAAVRPPGESPVPLGEVDLTEHSARPTGIGELDRVLGGGLVPGSVTLVGGEPGIGKSTLLLQALGALAGTGRRVLLVSAEESKQQVRMRAARLGALAPELYVVAETSLPDIVGAIEQTKPEAVVIDSIQTIYDPDIGSAPGSVVQVRECAHRLVGVAKQQGICMMLVGHVTKEGTLAGPRVLEHVVDTVLSFEGERHHALRLLRASKHRFGPTGELGIFEMTEAGMTGMPDAAGLLLDDRQVGVPGSVVVPAIEGQRPLLVEIQALIGDHESPMPSRSAQGLDSRRLPVLLAVLNQHAGYWLGKRDVYTSAVGGVRINEPAVDLAVALAVMSAQSGTALPPGVVACGEVGLGGEVRQVGHLQRRLAEAARLGFTHAVVPLSSPEPPPGIVALRVPDIRTAAKVFSLTPRKMEKASE
ncbi:MAG: hypothetical protein QOG03_402 [Actinomycetota bacterium]|jgi:DNA repair protein RadA/Sms|nr:hypothetical protein [Actinomycetota bacterium]